jgi:hypothetical protein
VTRLASLLEAFSALQAAIANEAQTESKLDDFHEPEHGKSSNSPLSYSLSVSEARIALLNAVADAMESTWQDALRPDDDSASQKQPVTAVENKEEEEVQEEKPTTWSCARCTLINPLTATKCGICDGPRVRRSLGALFRLLICYFNVFFISF